MSERLHAWVSKLLNDDLISEWIEVKHRVKW